MKISDLDYLESIAQENNVIVSGGGSVIAVASASSFSYASPSGTSVSDATSFSFSSGNNTYTLATGQVLTLPRLSFSRATAFAVASK